MNSRRKEGQQLAKQFDSHPGKWLFDGEPECGRRARVVSGISK
jgi:hypothetical protein